MTLGTALRTRDLHVAANNQIKRLNHAYFSVLLYDLLFKIFKQTKSA